jgi:hypothetical protein
VNFPKKRLFPFRRPGEVFLKHFGHASAKQQITKEVIERCLFPPIVMGGGNPARATPPEHGPPPQNWVHPRDRPEMI